jgi:hypothetical protein
MSRRNRARPLLNAHFATDFAEALLRSPAYHGLTPWQANMQKKKCLDWLWQQLPEEDKDRLLQTRSGPKALQFRLPPEQRAPEKEPGTSNKKSAAIDATPPSATTGTPRSTILDELFATSDEDTNVEATGPAVRQPAPAMTVGHLTGRYWGKDGYLAGIADVKELIAKRARGKAEQTEQEAKQAPAGASDIAEQSAKRARKMAEQAGQEAEQAREAAQREAAGRQSSICDPCC